MISSKRFEIAEWRESIHYVPTSSRTTTKEDFETDLVGPLPDT